MLPSLEAQTNGVNVCVYTFWKETLDQLAGVVPELEPSERTV